jgi:hypothetical protein
MLKGSLCVVSMDDGYIAVVFSVHMVQRTKGMDIMQANANSYEAWDHGCFAAVAAFLYSGLVWGSLLYWTWTGKPLRWQCLHLISMLIVPMPCRDFDSYDWPPFTYLANLNRSKWVSDSSVLQAGTYLNRANWMNDWTDWKACTYPP